MDLDIGTIVWCSIGGKTFWPAIIVNPADFKCKTVTVEKRIVYWFGDGRISEVHCNRIYCFQKKFTVFYYKGRKESAQWHNGVYEAIKAYAERTGHLFENLNKSFALRWARTGFSRSNTQCNLERTSYFDSDIMTKLSNKYNDENEESDDDDDYILNKQPSEMQLKLKSRKVSVDELCISCYQQTTSGEHPLFIGKICDSCLDSIRSTMYCFGDDGVNYFCAICSKQGEVIVCDHVNCGRVYCKDCLDTMGAPNAFEQIVDEDPWFCFVCESYRSNLNGLIMNRDDWREQVVKLFSVERKYPFDNIVIPKDKKAIRVLSLCDGISTGLFALDTLNITVEKYYSCELDEDAKNLVCNRFGDRIEFIGCTTDINEEKISSFGPIDLLLGGSPWNELKSVNLDQEDLSRTTAVFFEFYRILCDLRNNYKGRQIFWLFECLASISMCTSDILNRFLECKPVVLDVQWFSAQQIPKFYWGNLPSLYSKYEFENNTQMMFNYSLPGTCNRMAIIEKLKMVLAYTNPYEDSLVFQNVISNEESLKWIKELEEELGFPSDYTDVENLSVAQRQQLLSKTGNVHIYQWILQCLRVFFKTN